MTDRLYTHYVGDDCPEGHANDPDVSNCKCGVPVADTTLAHYMACSGGMPEGEAAEVGRVISDWASRELEAMGDTPPPKED